MMQRTIIGAALIELADAGTAMAACPTGKDIDGPGVVIQFNDNWSTLHKRTPAGTTLEISATSGDDDYFFESEMGIHVIAEGPWKDGGRVANQIVRFSLPEGVGLPKPAINMSWSATYDMKKPDGNVEKARTGLSSGGMAKMTTGAFTYDVIPMHFLFEPANETGTISALSFVPELGILVLMASGEMGGVYDTFFTPVGIMRMGQ